jgi:hypothetical protein
MMPNPITLNWDTFDSLSQRDEQMVDQDSQRGHNPLLLMEEEPVIDDSPLWAALKAENRFVKSTNLNGNDHVNL